ncbi:MAG TPA: DHHA1 domain-containing protein [Vicinamibacterales bacterium]|nr:DHHA1 domain-containing protein [Vicinamibacterales bacterium]
MTKRLYYTDPLLTSFDAIVVSSATADGRAEVVLDQTAFYPTSGGQPFDTGRLGSARVLDVIDREDGTIAHVTDAGLAPGASVRGDIEWPRRFDHMQQHTGQHVLSAAFDREHRVRTMSFHLGAEASTIDLAREVSPEEIRQAEQRANQVVWEDRPVGIRFATEEEASRLPLRKEPTRTGSLRLIEIPEFDLSACGGTHVPRTGMIGLIAVTAWERFKGATRLTFACGGRALASHRALRDVVTGATRALSVSAAELAPALERLRAESRDQGRALRQLQEEVAAHRAASLRAAAETIGPVRGVLSTVAGWDAAALKTLAVAIVSEPGLVAVLAGEGRPVPVVIARSADVATDASAWMRRAAGELGGRGGGRPDLAQGGLDATADEVLAFARHTLG